MFCSIKYFKLRIFHIGFLSIQSSHLKTFSDSSISLLSTPARSNLGDIGEDRSQHWWQEFIAAISDQKSGKQEFGSNLETGIWLVDWAVIFCTNISSKLNNIGPYDIHLHSWMSNLTPFFFILQIHICIYRNVDLEYMIIIILHYMQNIVFGCILQ